MNGLERVSGLVVEFYEKLSAWEQRVARGSGLTLPQMHTLEVVGQLGRPRMKELAARMGVTTGTLTVTVDGLEKRGLAERVPHETDRRSCLVALTGAGRRMFSEHHALHLDLARELTAAMTPEEARGFVAALAKANELLSRGTTGSGSPSGAGSG